MAARGRTSIAAVKSLVRRGDEALAAQDWDGAVDYYDRALDSDEGNADLLLRLFLANHHLLNVDELQGVAHQIVEETPSQKTPLARVLYDEALEGYVAEDDLVRLLHMGPLPQPVPAPQPDEAPEDQSDAEAAPVSEDADGQLAADDGLVAPDGARAAEVGQHDAVQPATLQSEASPSDARADEPIDGAATQRNDAAHTTVDAPEGAQAPDAAAQSQASSAPTAAPSANDAAQPAAEAPNPVDPSVPACPYQERLTNLRLSRDAFERTFEDELWRAAYEDGGLEQRRHMERAHADADAVLGQAFSQERQLLASMCQRARVRVPRIQRITKAALQSCDQALDAFRSDSGNRRQEVSNEFSYLGGNLRTAQATLWVGVALVVISVVLLGMAIIPHGASVQNNTFAAYPEYFVPLGILVGLVGVVLLVLRSLLVRSNRNAMDQQQASTGATDTSILRDADLLDSKVAAVRARCHALEGFALDASDDDFEAACADLDSAVKALGQ
ncbi:MAG: hypothetical protein ACI4B6_06950 [Atopobiaceae bacterium]